MRYVMYLRGEFYRRFEVRNFPGRSAQIMVQGALRSAGPCPPSMLIGAGFGNGYSYQHP